MLKAEIDVLCSWPQRWQVTISYCSLLRRKGKMSRAWSLMVNLGNKVTQISHLGNKVVTRQADLAGPRAKAIKAGMRTMATSVGFSVLLFLVYFTFGITCLSSQRIEEKHTQRKVVCNILRLSCVGSFSSVLETYSEVMKSYILCLWTVLTTINFLLIGFIPFDVVELP